LEGKGGKEKGGKGEKEGSGHIQNDL